MRTDAQKGFWHFCRIQATNNEQKINKSAQGAQSHKECKGSAKGKRIDENSDFQTNFTFIFFIK